MALQIPQETRLLSKVDLIWNRYRGRRQTSNVFMIYDDADLGRILRLEPVQRGTIDEIYLRICDGPGYRSQACLLLAGEIDVRLMNIRLQLVQREEAYEIVREVFLDLSSSEMNFLEIFGGAKILLESSDPGWGTIYDIVLDQIVLN